MKSRLEYFLEGVHPSRTIQEISRRADEAVNSFLIEYDLYDRGISFQTFMTEYLRYLQKNILNIPSTPDNDSIYCWGMCLNIFKRLYKNGAEKTAYDIFRSNTEGGRRKLLNDFAVKVGEHYANNEIAMKAEFFWNNLTHEEKFEVVKEYIEKYHHLIPFELRDGFPGRVYDNFTKILIKHAFSMDRLNKSFRR